MKSARQSFRYYLLKSPLQTAWLARLSAKGVDLFLVFLVGLFFYPIGAVVGLGYLAVSDSLPSGQSAGKRLVGLSVISLIDGGPCSFRQSVVRNLPFLAPLFFTLIPFWGWLFALILGAPLAMLEIYLLVQLESGHRLGDVMADTSVVHSTPQRVKPVRPSDSWFDGKEVQPG